MIDIVQVARSFNTSPGTVTVVLILLGIAIYLMQGQISNPQRRRRFLWTSIVGALLLVGLSGGFLSTEETSITISEDDLNTPYTVQSWQEDYEFSARANLVSYDVDVADTDYYDIDNPTIEVVANKIAAESDTSREAIERTLEYVYRKIDYVVGEPDNACFSGTAPDILLSGKGQCDTQSIVVVSILRKMGIAARPAGGCIVLDPRCSLQALFQSIGGFRTPIYTELKTVDEALPEFSRGAALSREGGLHAWAMAWTPDEGWLALESTAGVIANTKCYNYHVELYPENDQKSDICVSKDWNYAKACQLDDLTLLDKYGLGLVSEEDPK